MFQIIRSLSPIICAKQTTTPLAYLVSLLIFYLPLIIQHCHSNSKTTEFPVFAGPNSCNHKTLSHTNTKNIISAHLMHIIQGLVVFIQKPISCGKPSCLSITHIRQCLGRNEEKCPDCLLAQLNWNWRNLALQWLPGVNSVTSGM